MTQATTSIRRDVADAVEALLSNAISYEQYLERVPEETDDDAIAEVLELVEHTPRRGGMLGVNEASHTAHMQRIIDAVKRIRET